MFGLVAFTGPGTTISKRRTAVEFGVTAFTGPGPAISERDATIEFGLVTFACRCPAVLRSLPAVGGGFAAGPREAKSGVGRYVPTWSGLGSFGLPISLVRVAVALFRRSVAFVGVAVSLTAVLIPRRAGLIPLIGIPVAIVGIAISLTTGLIPHRAGLIPFIGIPVAIVGVAVSLTTGLIPRRAGLIPLIGIPVATVRVAVSPVPGLISLMSRFDVEFPRPNTHVPTAAAPAPGLGAWTITNTRQPTAIERTSKRTSQPRPRYDRRVVVAAEFRKTVVSLVIDEHRAHNRRQRVWVPETRSWVLTCRYAVVPALPPKPTVAPLGSPHPESARPCGQQLRRATSREFEPATEPRCRDFLTHHPATSKTVSYQHKRPADTESG